MIPSREVRIGGCTLGQTRPLTVIAGPCAIEGREHALIMAREVKAIAEAVQMPVIFKSSFDKANRTSAGSGRGVGLEEGLSILAEARELTGLPVLTDVHESWQCEPVGQVVDVLQIPAFLCRQTDLLKAAAATGRAINIKKGQFLAPWDMAQVTAKLEAYGAERVLVCERGASFGYNTLVSDMRSLHYLARTGWPVVFDATHSVQQPGGLGGSSGGQREFVPLLARAAVAVGVAAVFIETHDAPERALSDGPNQVPLTRLRELLLDLKRFDELAKAAPVVELA